jgi:hypothetical protein
MNNPVLLDLEETVVDSWESRMFLHGQCRRVLDFLQKNAGEFSLGLMSWAVHNDTDKAEFVSDLLEPLESMFGATFEHTWSMRDWSALVLKQHGFSLTLQDMFDCFRKVETLVLCRNAEQFANRKVFLVDDTVTHGLELLSPHNNLHFVFINPKRCYDDIPSFSR